MIKESLSTLKSLVGSAVKNVASEYKPTADNMGGAFTRIAQQGIANLSYRSPILADVASTMLHSFQNELVHRDKIKKHISSEDSNSLRTAITEKLGADTPKSKVEAEMFKVIDKMSKIVDAEGQEAAKKADVFKEFGEYFKNFRKTPEQSQNPQQQGATGEVEGTLGRIDVNTQKTAHLLAEIAAEPGSLTNPSPTTNAGETPQKTGSPSFIDPMTGLPSIKAAVGSIGGTFLAKVFDDELITKYATKLKTRMFGAEEEVTPTVATPVQEPSAEAPKAKRKIVPSQDRQAQNIEDILKGISLDLATPESFVPKTEDKNEQISRDAKKESTANSLLEQIIEQLKKLNEKKTTESDAKSSSGILDKITEKTGLKDLASKVPKGAGGMLARGAMAAGGVAAAGAAGYGIGTLLAPLIDKGITAASGEENTLGTWIYNKTHSDEFANSVTPKKSTQVTDIQRATKAMEESKAQGKASSSAMVLNTQPVVTNNNTTTVIANSSVRNQESTFERVQFQDYWSRVA